MARSRPASWYRTIDRVDPELQARPKLLLPDAIDAATAATLAEAFQRRDRAGATAAAAELYGISRSDLLAAAA